MSTGVSASHYGMPFSMKEDRKKIKTNNKLFVKNMKQLVMLRFKKGVTIRKVGYL